MQCEMLIVLWISVPVLVAMHVLFEFILYFYLSLSVFFFYLSLLFSWFSESLSMWLRVMINHFVWNKQHHELQCPSQSSLPIVWLIFHRNNRFSINCIPYVEKRKKQQLWNNGMVGGEAKLEVWSEHVRHGI